MTHENKPRDLRDLAYYLNENMIMEIITKLNKHLPSVKVNLNSCFGGGPWVYVGTLRQSAYLRAAMAFLLSFFLKLTFFMPQGRLVGT